MRLIQALPYSAREVAIDTLCAIAHNLHNEAQTSVFPECDVTSSDLRFLRARAADLGVHPTAEEWADVLFYFDGEGCTNDTI